MSENLYTLTIFNGIDRKTVDSIINKCERENFAAGETIFQQEEESNGKGYIIQTGKVKILINEQKVAELDQGTMVGEIALLNEEERTASVVAIENTVMIVLKIDDLIDMINNDENKINKEIMRRIEENLENS